MSGPRATERARERLRAGLPLTPRRLAAGGADTFVLEGGEGPPLVLLHGAIEAGGAYWGPVIAPLAARHRVVVPDAPGLGESAPLGRLDAGAFARWLAALVRQTCAEPPTLVAHSLLASHSAWFAAAHGGLLRRLVLLGAPAIARYRMPLGLLVASIRLELRPGARSLERFVPWAFRDPGATRRLDPAWFDAFTTYLLARTRVPHVRRAIRQLVRAGTRRIPDADLRRIAAPVALLWGRHDRMVPLCVAADASAALGWPLHVVDDAGHVPFVERRETFVAALRRILDDAAPGGSPGAREHALQHGGTP